MFKSIWSTAIVALVGTSLLLTPATSEAQRRGGGGRGGRGGGERGGSWSGGERNEGRGWDGGGRGWGGGYGGYGLGGGYYGGWSSPGYYGNSGYYGSSDFGTPVYGDSQVITPQYSFYPDNQYTTGNMQPQMSNPNDASFVVRISDPNAQIWFQDYKTQQRGTVRHFESEALDPNSTYTFTVRAKWMDNGKQMDQTREVQARAGQRQTVDFGTQTQEQIPTSPQRRPLSNDLNNQQFNNQNQEFNNPNQRVPNSVNPNNQSPNRQLPNSPNPQPNQPNQQGSVVNPQR